jgi:hemerythrin superfamily protein
LAVDAIALLAQQHREVEDLFDRFEQTDAPSQQGEIARTATLELRLHTTIEEELFYPAVRAQGGELEASVLEDLEEHHVVEMLLDELDAMSPDDERFGAKFTVVSELVRHHLEEEEDEQFPLVRDAMSQQELADLGQQMEARYAELKAEAETIDLTKEELYQRAQELDIEGRSQMSKRELASAIRAHQR